MSCVMRHLLRCAGVSLVVALAGAVAAQSPANPASGIELQYLDASTRPQDDFYRHANGRWLDSTPIPADRGGYGPAYELIDRAQDQLRAIVEAATSEAPAGSDARKVGDLYASFMDEARIAQVGLRPLQPLFARIDAIRSKREIPALMAELERVGVTVPIEIGVDQDSRRSTEYAAEITQSGLGLPDRDYYLARKDTKLVTARAAYATYVRTLLALAGDRDAGGHALDILALETGLARAQWSRVQNRDPVKTYNRMKLEELPRLTSAFDWASYLRASQLHGHVRHLIVGQPSYFKAFGKLLNSTPLATWKVYFRFQVLHAYAPYLDTAFVDASFAFSGRLLRGIPENRPRWKRGIDVIESSLGFAMGRLYVERHFPPENKARVERLVANVKEAYRLSIAQLDWMGPATRREAQAKLAKLTVKVAYPTRGRDYTGLAIRRDDLVGNVMRATAFEHARNRAKLGKPIDRSEWFMTPQTVNAYYSPGLNEIVLPAAYLQPPYFNAEADDAANYGGVGATIGHEISHAFDDQGSQFDGDGNLRVWWTRADRDRFVARTRALVAQFSAYSPLPGYRINGELTLGENIADLSGLAVAYRAWRLSLGREESASIDGLTGDQRFFLSYAQGWRDKTRPEQQIVYLKSDAHAPDKFRCNGSLVNFDPFHAAFAVKPGDAMYVPPEKRVRIW